MSLVVVSFLLLAASRHAGDSGILYEKDSIYQNLRVVQNGTVRRLFGGNMSFSAMDISQPYDHEMEYTRMMILGMAYADQPKNLLMIGLGAGTVATYLRKYYPDMQMTLVELDPDVVTCAEQYFNFKADDRMTVLVQDGRWHIMRDKTAYDLILLDAYHGDYIPFHLLTKEFLELVRAHLTPNGIVISNTWALQALAERESATYAEVFGQFDSFSGVHSGNRIIIAAQNGAKLGEATLRQRMVDIQAERRFQELSLPVLFGETYDKQVTWPPKTQLLTDDYAPVNTLIDWK